MLKEQSRAVSSSVECQGNRSAFLLSLIIKIVHCTCTCSVACVWGVVCVGCSVCRGCSVYGGCSVCGV